MIDRFLLITFNTCWYRIFSNGIQADHTGIIKKSTFFKNTATSNRRNAILWLIYEFRQEYINIIFKWLNQKRKESILY